MVDLNTFEGIIGVMNVTVMRQMQLAHLPLKLLEDAACLRVFVNFFVFSWRLQTKEIFF